RRARPRRRARAPPAPTRARPRRATATGTVTGTARRSKALTSLRTERRGQDGRAALASANLAAVALPRSAPERSTAAFVAALAVATFLFAWGALQYGFYTHRLLLDTPLYERYGDKMLEGQVPYRDFTVEYPPAALPVFVAPSVPVGRKHFHAYTQVFEGLMGLCGMAAVAAVSVILLRDG